MSAPYVVTGYDDRAVCWRPADEAEHAAHDGATRGRPPARRASYALADLLRLPADPDRTAARVADFIRLHGPLWLCAAHGQPFTHAEGCEPAFREPVAGVLRIARNFRALAGVSRWLRRGRPLPAETRRRLALSHAPPDPRVYLMAPAERERLLTDPVLCGWRDLEAWLGWWRRLAAPYEGLGPLPPLARQLTAACRRDGQHRVCANPECQSEFRPRRPNRLYCHTDACDAQRNRQRVRRARERDRSRPMREETT